MSRIPFLFNLILAGAVLGIHAGTQPAAPGRVISLTAIGQPVRELLPELARLSGQRLEPADDGHKRVKVLGREAVAYLHELPEGDGDRVMRRLVASPDETLAPRSP